MLSADWSDGVRCGPIGSDWVISHTGVTKVRKWTRARVCLVTATATHRLYTSSKPRTGAQSNVFSY